MQSRQTVRTATAFHKLLVVFGTGTRTGQDNAVTTSISELRKVIRAKGRFLAHGLFSARLNQIEEQYQQVTSNRNKRGLFNIIGDIGSALFGFGTQADIDELKEVIRQNQDYTSKVIHSHNQLVTIVNVTRVVVSENRYAINQLINATSMLKMYVEDVQMRTQMYNGVMVKLNMLQEHVNEIRRVDTKMLRMRKDLEKGYLSEDLLPVSSLEKLATSPLIPAGSEFVTPLHWYYSGLQVKLVSINDDLVYYVNLPLVSPYEAYSTTLKSYPTPNLHKNVTIQLKVKGTSVLNGQTGQVTDITNQCVGENPTVCPAMPVRRKAAGQQSCQSALVSNSDISHACPVEVVNTRQDQLIYHSINSFILVTWGTEVSEECLHSSRKSLEAGTYLIQWDGKCSLCTVDHCIQGTIVSGSALKLSMTWTALDIPSLSEFTGLKLADSFKVPSPLSKLTDIQFEQLTVGVPDTFVWSKSNLALIIIIIFVIICIVSGLVFLVYRRKCIAQGRALFVDKESTPAEEVKGEVKSDSSKATTSIESAETDKPLLKQPFLSGLSVFASKSPSKVPKSFAGVDDNEDTL